MKFLMQDLADLYDLIPLACHFVATFILTFWFSYAIVVDNQVSNMFLPKI